MTFKSAFADEHLKIYSDTQPHILHRTFGITYDQFTYPKQVSVSYRNSHGTAAEWMELITCDTASPLMYYEHKSWGRYCAAAENVYQKGHTLYLASLFDEEVLIELLSHFLYETISLEEPDKIQLPVSYPVSLKQGINDNQEHILYLLNYSDSKQSVTNTACDATELISGQPCPKGSSLTLEAWGVAILCIP
jgi:beta-galactosidase